MVGRRTHHCLVISSYKFCLCFDCLSVETHRRGTFYKQQGASLNPWIITQKQVAGDTGDNIRATSYLQFNYPPATTSNKNKNRQNNVGYLSITECEIFC